MLLNIKWKHSQHMFYANVCQATGDIVSKPAFLFTFISETDLITKPSVETKHQNRLEDFKSISNLSGERV